MSFPKVQLGTLATVGLGITLRGADASRHDPEGSHQLIRIGDLGEEGILLPPSEPNRIRLDLAIAQRFALRQGDVLLAARGLRMTAACFDGDYQAVAGGQFLVIRILDVARLSPAYLHGFLNLPSTQEALSALARGSYIRSLSAKTLAQLPLPLPPMSLQHILAELNALRLRERALLAQLAERRSILVDQVFSKSLSLRS